MILSFLMSSGHTYSLPLLLKLAPTLQDTFYQMVSSYNSNRTDTASTEPVWNADLTSGLRNISGLSPGLVWIQWVLHLTGRSRYVFLPVLPGRPNHQPHDEAKSSLWKP